MRAKFLLLSFVAVVAIIVGGSANVFTNIAEPPTGNTGAPGELTCGNSACHNVTPVFNVNDATGIKISGIPTTGITAGTLYNVIVNTGNNSPRYGYSLTAIDGNTAASAKAGEFSANGANLNSNSFQTGVDGRQYAGHKNASGTNAYVITWTAPNPLPAEVYFYLAVNKTNADSTFDGDNVSLRAYKATSSTFAPFNVSTGIASLNIDNSTDIKIFPNPVRDNLNLSIDVYENSDVTAGIYNLNGQLVKDLITESLTTGTYNRSFNVANELSTGMYLVKLNMNGQTYFKKIIVE